MKQWEHKAVCFGRPSIFDGFAIGFFLWIFFLLSFGFLSLWVPPLNPFNSKTIYFVSAQAMGLSWVIFYVPYKWRQARKKLLIEVKPGDLVEVRPNEATYLPKDFFKAKVLEVSTERKKSVIRKSFHVTNLNTNQSIWVKAKQICVSEKVLDAQPKSLYQQYVDEKGN